MPGVIIRTSAVAVNIHEVSAALMDSVLILLGIEGKSKDKKAIKIKAPKVINAEILDTFKRF